MTLQNYSLDESKKLNQFCVERGLSDSSKRKYKVCLKRYVTYFDMTLEELIEEADNEEETIARESKRKIRERLIEFRVFLKENYSTNTLKTTLSSVNTVYKHFGITVPQLPPMAYTKSPNEDIEFSDLPTIDHIKQAIENVNTQKHKALFLFIACTGSARNETANFTFGQFRDGIKEYFPDIETPEDIINALDGKCEGAEPIMPCFKMERKKTQYSYYTIVTPECVQFMINYLKSSGLGLKSEDSFFQLNVNGITSAFRSINNKMEWGKKGTVDFFSPHRIRKFHASVIEDTELANYIEGRKPSKIKEAYFKKNKIRVREEYTKHIHKFSIYSRYDVLINSEAYNQLLKEKEALEKQLKEMKMDNESLASQIVGIQNQIKDITRANNVARIQEYIADNEVVKENNLSSVIFELYNSDEDKGLVTMIDNEYIETLISRAYNRSRQSVRPTRNYGSADKEYKKLKDKIDKTKDSYIKSKGYYLTDSQNQRLNSKLDDYFDKLSFKEVFEPDREYIIKLIEEIAK